MIAYVRNEDILGEQYLPDGKTNTKIGIVWLPGLPNRMAPEMGQPLSDLGFTVLQTRYPGNRQSHGDFGPSSSVIGSLMGLELLSKGSTLDLHIENWRYFYKRKQRMVCQINQLCRVEDFDL